MDGPTRVLMVTTSYPRHEGDHAGHFVAALAERIAGAGRTVTVLAPHEGALPESETVRGVHIERFRYLPGRAERIAYGSGIVENLRHRPLAALGLPAFVMALRRGLRRLADDCDLIHVHWGPTAALAAPWRLPKPYVLTLHGSDVTLARRGGVWLRMLKRALASAAGVIVVANAQRDFLLNSRLWDEERPLAVIPSGVPGELLERPIAGRAEGPFVFLFVGRLVESKGVLELLAAFSELRAAAVDAELHVIGDGPLGPTVREAAASDAMEGRIRMRGGLPHAEALEAIAGAGALVLPSHGEGSPLVVAEALALGTPVIGTQVGAMPELLGADGLLSEPGDVSGLARNMTLLAADAGLGARLAAEGRQRAAATLSWAAVTRATLEFYGTVVGAHAEGDSAPEAATW